jgi:hypothetical protein
MKTPLSIVRDTYQQEKGCSRRSTTRKRPTAIADGRFCNAKNYSRWKSTSPL